ncbi:MAG: ribonuclease E inhibitor RraB [Planctomycetota bacterium]
MTDSQQSFPDDEDGAVLASLAESGIDLNRPLEVEFVIDAPSEEAAGKIAEAVRAQGHECNVDYDEGEPDEDGKTDPDDEEFGPSWAIYVAIEMVPEHQRIVDLQRTFTELAQAHGGECDGWGVMT